MPRVIQFAIAAHDPEQEAGFYRKVLGWRITRNEMVLPWGAMPYWEIETGGKETPGIDGFMLQRPQPGAVTFNVIEVASVDETVRLVEQHGGKVLEGKQAIPGLGWLAACEDAQGMGFDILEPDPAAGLP
jgi:uncharacterized protein